MTIRGTVRIVIIGLVLCAAALVVAEAYLRLAYFGFSARALGPWHERPAWEQIRSLDPDGSPWPLSGGIGRWSLQPGGPPIDYVIDERGFRVIPQERDEPRAASACRILTVGDSDAFGYGVRAEEALPARLALRLAADGIAAVVENAGVCASSVRRHRQMLERILKTAAVHVVVIIETPWSLRLDPAPANPAERFADKLWNLAEAKTGALATYSAVADRASRKLFHLSNQLLGWPASSSVAWEMLPLLESREQFVARWRDVAREIEQMVAIVREFGASPVLVFVPLDLQVDVARNRLYEDERLPYPAYGFEVRDYTRDDRYRTAVHALASALGVTLLDETTVLRTSKDAAFLASDYHPSPLGYELMAADLAATVGEACASRLGRMGRQDGRQD